MREMVKFQELLELVYRMLTGWWDQYRFRRSTFNLPWLTLISKCILARTTPTLLPLLLLLPHILLIMLPPLLQEFRLLLAPRQVQILLWCLVPQIIMRKMMIFSALLNSIFRVSLEMMPCFLLLLVAAFLC